MKIETTPLDGVKILHLKRHPDKRGSFGELYQQRRYASQGITAPFVQLNHSISAQGVVRGLHTQMTKPQGKLVFVTHGAILDVVADINPQSPTFKQHLMVELSASNQQQLWIPPGYGHGFLSLSAEAHCYYFCTDFYDPEDETGIRWDCPQLGIPWPIAQPILSARDRGLPDLAGYLQRQAPR